MSLTFVVHSFHSVYNFYFLQCSSTLNKSFTGTNTPVQQYKNNDFFYSHQFCTYRYVWFIASKRLTNAWYWSERSFTYLFVLSNPWYCIHILPSRSHLYLVHSIRQTTTPHLYLPSNTDGPTVLIYFILPAQSYFLNHWFFSK